jgi:phosphopantetheine--protein transferase-like protein
MHVGVDLVCVGELDRLHGRRWFERYVYAAAELAAAEGMPDARRREFLAGRFAAKEAILKVFRTGLFQGIAPREVAVSRAQSGVPEVTLYGAASAAAKDAGISHLSVSITHKGELIIAMAAGW